MASDISILITRFTFLGSPSRPKGRSADARDFRRVIGGSYLSSACARTAGSPHETSAAPTPARKKRRVTCTRALWNLWLVLEVPQGMGTYYAAHLATDPLPLTNFITWTCQRELVGGEADARKITRRSRIALDFDAKAYSLNKLLTPWQGWNSVAPPFLELEIVPT